jgi:hypothetical protein
MKQTNNWFVFELWLSSQALDRLYWVQNTLPEICFLELSLNPLACFDGFGTSVISRGVAYFYGRENSPCESWHDLFIGEQMYVCRELL